MGPLTSKENSGTSKPGAFILTYEWINLFTLTITGENGQFSPVFTSFFTSSLQTNVINSKRQSCSSLRLEPWACENILDWIQPDGPQCWSNYWSTSPNLNVAVVVYLDCYNQHNVSGDKVLGPKLCNSHSRTVVSGNKMPSICKPNSTR